ncbi:MAG: EAL domain-containing protein [Propionivibrio sp.]|nr:EAL domain-containing protein [Propionivibrio sp.]
MKLNTRYAIYLASAVLAGALIMVFMVGLHLFLDGDQYRERFQKDLKLHLIIDQQESLTATAGYLSHRLFDPLSGRDIVGLDQEIREIGALLPIRRFTIVDADGRVVTDGTPDNAQRGRRLDDERIRNFDLTTPHVYSFPGVDGEAGGIGMVFSIRRDDQLAGYARVVLEENLLISSSDRVSSLLRSMWGSALEMFYRLSLAAGFGALLIAVLFSSLFSRLLSSPLRSMSLAARKYAGGDLDYVIPLASRDEFGDLARSLNSLASQIRKTGRLLNKAQEMSGVGGWEYDVRQGRFSWSPKVGRILRVDDSALPETLDALIGRVHPEDHAALLDILARDFTQNANFHTEFRLCHCGGALLTLQVVGEVTLDEKGSPRSMIGTFQDVSDRKRSEERLTVLANFDALTGLPNRALFQDRLAQALARAARGHAQVGLLFIDLDQFKAVNDRLGHAFGDELLKQVSRRLSQAVREVDTVARMGGDEFTIILEGIPTAETAAMVAGKVLQTLAPPIFIGAQELYVTASIGVAVYPTDAEQGDDLLSHADTAMYRAKEEGTNTYRVFTREMEERIQGRLALETALRGALQHDEFVLFYQPQVEIRSGEVVGFEALIRWKRADGTLVSPIEFVPLLEESGLIVEVGAWVIAEACRWLARWRRAHDQETTVSVNLSPRQFREPDLAEVVDRALAASCLPASALELEITESSLVSGPATLQTMATLRQMGVGLAIDDFGTGYSSLSYLKRFPITKLKIDRSFISDIAEDPDSAAIVSAIIALAKILQLQVVAEGVEHVEELAFLRQQGCGYIQGYLASRPLDQDAIEDWYGQTAKARTERARVVPLSRCA